MMDVCFYEVALFSAGEMVQQTLVVRALNVGRCD